MRTSIAVLFTMLATAPADAITTIFLDRCDGGCSYTPGFDDSRTDVSSIVSQASAVSGFAWGDESWEAVVACVRDAFAPFDARVTDVDPDDAEHLEIAVGGAPQQVGLPAGVTNVSPVTCEGDRVVANGIGFAFAATIGDEPATICWNAAQAAGSLLGLDHVLLAGDVMTYLSGSLPKQFLDETGSCGESTPRTCQCGGTTQNSHQWLLATLPEPTSLASGIGAVVALAALRRRASLRS